MYKRLVSIALLLSLFLPVIGTGTFLLIQKMMVQGEVKSQLLKGMADADLVLFKFNKLEIKHLLKWENVNEFEYQDQMYDVVRTKTIDKITYFWCLADYKETKLKKQIRALTLLVLNHDQQRKKDHEKLLSFFKSLFFNDPPEIRLFSPLDKNKTFGSLRYFYHLDSMRPHSPPPVI
ncbi:MAG: hypothetical protein KDC69_03765 [Flavobacteriaceae bacterium]|nr:hypothetical protein [Flavobacteriaceae bacterium]